MFEHQEHVQDVFSGFMPNSKFSAEDEYRTARYLYIRNNTRPYIASIQQWYGTRDMSILSSSEFANTTILDTTRQFLESENKGSVADLHITQIPHP